MNKKNLSVDHAFNFVSSLFSLLLLLYFFSMNSENNKIKKKQKNNFNNKNSMKDQKIHYKNKELTVKINGRI